MTPRQKSVPVMNGPDRNPPDSRARQCAL